MELFAKEIFDPEVGLFIQTSDHLLMINPNASVALGEDFANLFYFVGKMMGKALYEVNSFIFQFSDLLTSPQPFLKQKLLFQSEFSFNFLNNLLGRKNELDDFYHYDAQIYASLMDLKKRLLQNEDISQLELHFEVSKLSVVLFSRFKLFISFSRLRAMCMTELLPKN
jgi:hypothetical protein